MFTFPTRWVWRAGLVAGLRVGQVFGMLLLLGFGVGSFSPQVPGYPTPMCNTGMFLELITSNSNLDEMTS